MFAKKKFFIILILINSDIYVKSNNKKKSLNVRNVSTQLGDMYKTHQHTRTKVFRDNSFDTNSIEQLILVDPYKNK